MLALRNWKIRFWLKKSTIVQAKTYLEGGRGLGAQPPEEKIGFSILVASCRYIVLKDVKYSTIDRQKSCIEG